MNILAHLFLSGNNPHIMVGNFIGDAVKGKKLYDYPPEITEGIRLHRNIDDFTDHHPVAGRSRQRLYAVYHKYAGVIIDIFYDHFLANHWRAYSATPFHEFERWSYEVLQEHREVMPSGMQQKLDNMVSQQWLANYKQTEGIRRALEGMARRTTFNSGMEHAVHDLRKHYEAFSEDFKVYFPQLIAFVEEQKKIKLT